MSIFTHEKNKNRYPLTIISFTIILPTLFTVLSFAMGSTASLVVVWSRWFIMCALGLRLFCAGLVQLIKPTYTLHTIFNISDIKSTALVQELGVHNLLLGGAIMSTFLLSQYSSIMVLIGAAYFGIAGLLHALRTDASLNQRIAMISDLLIAGIAIMMLMLDIL